MNYFEHLCFAWTWSIVAYMPSIWNKQPLSNMPFAVGTENPVLDLGIPASFVVAASSILRTSVKKLDFPPSLETSSVLVEA